jgi:hypothetical protein
MSLFDEAEKARNPFLGKKEEKTIGQKRVFINQTSSLLNILNEVATSHKITNKKAKSCSSFRTRLGDSAWNLHSLQGKVTAEGWANIVRNSVKGMLKTIKHSQPNGEWAVMDYDVKIDFDAEQIERVFFIVKFVDLENQEDLLYRNGVPVTTTVNVQTSPIPDELVSALTSKKTDDSELKDLIKQLVVAMASNTVQTETVSTPPAAPAPAAEPAPVVFED